MDMIHNKSKTFVVGIFIISKLYRIITVRNVSTAMCKIFSNREDVQYYGGWLVLRRMFSNLEDVHYFRGCSILER